MTLISYRGPLQLTHVKYLNCTPTSIGRCGIQNLFGFDIKKFVMRLRGNLASGGSK